MTLQQKLEALSLSDLAIFIAEIEGRIERILGLIADADAGAANIPNLHQKVKDLQDDLQVGNDVMNTAINDILS